MRTMGTFGWKDPGLFGFLLVLVLTVLNSVSLVRLHSEFEQSQASLLELEVEVEDLRKKVEFGDTISIANELRVLRLFRSYLENYPRDDEHFEEIYRSAKRMEKDFKASFLRALKIYPKASKLE